MLFRSQVGDVRKTAVVGGHQTRQWVLAHQRARVLGPVKLLGQVHVPDSNKTKAPEGALASFPLNSNVG